MSIYKELPETYQSWLESAWESAQDYATGTYLKELSWEILMKAALEAASPEVKKVFSRCANSGVTLDNFIQYLEDSVGTQDRVEEQGDLEDDHYLDGFSRQWLTALQSASGNEAEAWSIFLSLDVPEVIEEEVGAFFVISKLKKGFELLSQQTTAPAIALFSPDGTLLNEYFSQASLSAMQNAAKLAAQNASDFITPIHVLSAILFAGDQAAERSIRKHLPPEIPFSNLQEYLQINIPKRHPEAKPLEVTAHKCSQFLLDKLADAAREMQKRGAERLSLLDLLLGLLLNDKKSHHGKIHKVFGAYKIDPVSLCRELDKANSEDFKEQPIFIPEVLMGRDLNWETGQGLVREKVIHEGPEEEGTGLSKQSPFKQAADKARMILFKKKRNSVIILAERGTGRTSLIEQLALEIARQPMEGQHKKLLLFDCAKIAPSQKETFLKDILQFAYGKKDVVICLDGLETIFLGEESIDKRSASFLDQFQYNLQKNDLQFLITISPNVYQVSFGKDFRVKKLFEHQQLPEPDDETTKKIMKQLIPSWQENYGLAVSEEAINKACRLTGQYILSEYFPSKAIQVIEEAADSRSTQTAKEEENTVLNAEDVIQAVAKLTGVPAETLRGDTGEENFESQLKNSVIGQPEAVKVCANELGLIKAGMKNPEKPASVMLFLGMTGTGKTELAKAIANVYSSSKRLVTFTMGNFREPHSVSGLIGAPPGYVGYDEGGPLINEINKDPYCVVLLDEIEKAHPEVWKPFLNLFDEGWIVDQKNVKAYANRSIFILTSNKGAEEIYQIFSRLPAGKKLDDEDKIYEKMQKLATKELNESIHPETHQPCFTPEFLARIQQKMVFRPLDSEALKAILSLFLNKKKKTYLELREKELQIAKEVELLLAMECNLRYKASGGKEGGRVVHKVISEYVDGTIQKCSMEEFRAADKLIISLPENLHAKIPELENLIEKLGPELQGMKGSDHYFEEFYGKIAQILKDARMRVQRADQVWHEIQQIKEGFQYVEQEENYIRGLIKKIEEQIEGLEERRVMDQEIQGMIEELYKRMEQKEENQSIKQVSEELASLLNEVELKAEQGKMSKGQLDEKIRQLFEESRSSSEAQQNELVRSFNRKANALREMYKTHYQEDFPSLRQWDGLQQLQKDVLKKIEKKQIA
ncbi:MAG: AAA family ATPase [Lewinellaceae bacterium]|nr:AAA family ATPase [Lewinellaceae bacterium]